MDKRNIFLIGMPSCGKTTIGRVLAAKLRREFFDTDIMIEKATGTTIPKLHREIGEDMFRDLESGVLSGVSEKKGAVIATGGGCVLREENRGYMEGGVIVWLQRDLALLSLDGRISNGRTTIDKLYMERRERYESFAQYTADNNGTPEETALSILEMLGL